MIKHLKLLAFLPVGILFCSHMALASGSMTNGEDQTKSYDNEVRVLMDDIVTHKAKNKRGAEARTQLAYLIFQGFAKPGLTSFGTLTEQLKQVMRAHFSNTLVGARARCLLAIARIRGLVGEEVVTLADTVTSLKDVISDWESDSIPGAIARINLTTMRAQLQIDDEVLGIHDAMQMTLETIDAATHARLQIDFDAAHETYRLLQEELSRVGAAAEAEEDEIIAEPEQKDGAEPESKKPRVMEAPQADAVVSDTLFEPGFQVDEIMFYLAPPPERFVHADEDWLGLQNMEFDTSLLNLEHPGEIGEFPDIGTK